MNDRQSVPAGWYEDPEHPGVERYWNALHWTDQIRSSSSSSGTPDASPQTWDSTPTRYEDDPWETTYDPAIRPTDDSIWAPRTDPSDALGAQSWIGADGESEPVSAHRDEPEPNRPPLFDEVSTSAEPAPSPWAPQADEHDAPEEPPYRQTVDIDEAFQSEPAPPTLLIANAANPTTTGNDKIQRPEFAVHATQPHVPPRQNRPLVPAGERRSPWTKGRFLVPVGVVAALALVGVGGFIGARSNQSAVLSTDAAPEQLAMTDELNKQIDNLGYDFAVSRTSGRPFWATTFKVSAPDGYWETRYAQGYACQIVGDDALKLSNQFGQPLDFRISDHHSGNALVSLARQGSTIVEDQCEVTVVAFGSVDRLSETIVFSNEQLFVEFAGSDFFDGQNNGEPTLGQFMVREAS